MIRYLVLETFKSQLAILLVLLLVFFCQKLVRILAAVIDGAIPTNLVLFLLGLGIPEMMRLILPLSLFLGLLITFDKFHTESEIIAMYSCGLSKSVLVKAAMVLALFTGIVAAVNVFWVAPFFSRYQDKILTEVKVNPSMATLSPGQFQQMHGGNLVLFIKNNNGKRFNEIFLAQLHPKGNARPSIIVADSGQMLQNKDGSRIIMLNQGTRFEGTAKLRDFYITDFQNYQMRIGHQTVILDPSNTEQMDMYTLINSDTNCAHAELHWRITLIFTIFIMAIMVVPSSALNARQRGLRVISMTPVIFAYLLFFLLQASIRSHGAKGNINPMVWTWTVNSLYLFLALGLNLWDTVLMHRLRAKFMRKEPY